MKEDLISLGLTEREADAYLALYNFKEATATEISKIAKEHRSNIYDSLNALIKRGLISYSIKNNVTYYRVSDPEKLMDYVKEKERLVELLLPQLKSKLTMEKDKPTLEVYEGKEGFKSILSLALREKSTIYVIGASDEWEKQFPIKIEHYMKEREKNKIYAKLLYTQGIKPIINKMNEFRFLPVNLSQPSTIAIFGQYVAILMWTEPLVASLTKSRALSDSFRNYFMQLWKSAKK